MQNQPTNRIEREVEFEEAINRAVAATLKSPLWGARNVLRVNLDPWQEELLEAVWDAERFRLGKPTKVNHVGCNKITVRAMHGPGKTFGVSVLAHLWNFTHRSLGFATAPKEKQLADRLWPSLTKVRSGAIEEYRNLVKVDNTRVTFAGDRNWGITAETASHPDNLAGYHDDHILIICEEANGIEEKFFPVIEGAASTGVCPILVMIGNPTTTKGTFALSHLSPKTAKHYYRLHVSLDKTTRVKPDWVAQMVEKYGDDSDVVRVRCRGEFPKEDSDQLIYLHWIHQAYQRTLPETLRLNRPRKIIIADIADGGEDATVVTLLYDYGDYDVWVKQIQKRFPTSESPILAGELIDSLWKDENCDANCGDRVIVDSLGVGAGTAGFLIREKHLPVIAYKGGESSDDAEKWRNKRTQSYIGAAEALRKGTVIINEDFTDDPSKDSKENEEAKLEFEAQMTSIRRKPHQARVDEIESKKDMGARGVKSPDRADGIVMRYGAISSKVSLSGITVVSVSHVHTTIDEASPFLITGNEASPWA